MNTVMKTDYILLSENLFKNETAKFSEAKEKVRSGIFRKGKRDTNRRRLNVFSFKVEERKDERKERKPQPFLQCGRDGTRLTVSLKRTGIVSEPGTQTKCALLDTG